MAQQLQTHADLGYLAIVLLLAYVLTSAPRYVRNFDDNRTESRKAAHRSITRQVVDAGKLAVNEYVKAWKMVQQSVQPVVPPAKDNNKPSLTQNLPGFFQDN
jgi:uncharacterized protein (UPF0297 family)